MSKRKTLSLRVLKHALLLSGQLWQVCITTSICLVKRNQRKFKVMRTQHLIFITSHLTDHHCTVSVRTNQHRHKMLDILPSKPQGVRTQLASSSSPSPSLSSWSHRDGGLQGTADCTVSCLPVLSLLPALLTSHVPHGSGVRADQGWTLVHFTTTSAGKEFSEDDSTIVLHPIKTSIHTLQIIYLVSATFIFISLLISSIISK